LFRSVLARDWELWRSVFHNSPCAGGPTAPYSVRKYFNTLYRIRTLSFFADTVANIFPQSLRFQIVALRFDNWLQDKMPNSKLIRDKICRAHSTR
jgi:hypothetical protein